MEIDHFNPKVPGRKRNTYSNLFQATRHCNNAKSDTWPSSEDKKLGLRFLNPCKERDYGKHIFEDKNSHELIGVTSAGEYHIDYLDLNAPHLVHERATRSRLRNILNDTGIIAKPATDASDEITIGYLIQAITKEKNDMIPDIPFKN